MGWIDRLFSWVRRDDSTSTSRIPWLGPSKAGVTVTPDEALKQATVWACLTYLSRTVAQLPWRVMQPGSDGGRAKPMTTHTVSRLLATRPHPEYSPFAFKEIMVYRAAARGNAVALITPNNRGEPVALTPVHPDRVDFTRNADTGELQYEILDGTGQRVVYPASRVFHVRGFGDGAVGLDVVTYAAESIGWAQATETFGSTWFSQGVAPTGILYLKQRLSVPGKDLLQREIDQRHGGASKAHRTVVVDSDGSYQRVVADPSAAQLVETRQHQVEDICRWFGVPPHKVMHLLRSTFSNIEHQSIEVVVDSITPWCLRLEQEADYKLFGRNMLGLYTKLDVKGLLRGDYKSRQEGLQIMRRNGIINADQWAELEDMPAPGVANGGDRYIVEGNMTLLSSVGEPKPEPGTLPANPADTSPPDAPEDDDSVVDRARKQRARAERRFH